MFFFVSILVHPFCEESCIEIFKKMKRMKGEDCLKNVMQLISQINISFIIVEINFIQIKWALCWVPEIGRGVVPPSTYHVEFSTPPCGWGQRLSNLLNLPRSDCFYDSFNWVGNKRFFRLIPNQLEDGEFSMFSVSFQGSGVDFLCVG